MTHDYKKALDILANHQKWRRGCDETPATEPKDLGIAIDAAIHALRIADKLMQEPSYRMLELGFNAVVAFDRDETAEYAAFKAMRDQLLRELDEPVDAQERGDL